MDGYNKDEKIRVIKCIYGHQFKIGEIVIIGGFGRDSFDGSLTIYAFTDEDKIGWALGVDEVEKIEEEKKIDDNWILDPLKEEE